MKNNFKKFPFLISLILFIVLTLGFFFLYREINLNNAKATQSLIDLDNESNARNRTVLLNKSIETIKEDSILLDTHFAKSSDVVPFLDTVEGLAPQAGVKEETKTVDVLGDNSGLEIKMSASGSFKNIYKFLTLLENSPYELQVTSLDIQKDEIPSSTTANTPTPTGASIPAPSSNANWQATFTLRLLSFVP